MLGPSPAVRASSPTLPQGGLLGAWSGGLAVWVGRLVVTLAALVLLLSGALKIVSTAALLGGDGLLSGPIRLGAVVALEGGVAGLLLTLPVAWAARLGLFVFAAFGSVAAWTLWSGGVCGCFGPGTPRGLPLSIDGLAVLVLGWLVWRTSVDGSSRIDGLSVDATGWVSGVEVNDLPAISGATSGGNLIKALTVAGLLAAAGGAAASWRVSSIGDRHGWPVWFGPESIGNRLPWPEGLKTNADGQSAWILLRPDCQHCREFANAWEHGERFGIDDEVVVGVAIEPGRWTFMPGFVSADPVASDGNAVHQFDADEPFVATPMVVQFEGAVVRWVREPKDLESPEGHLSEGI